MNVALLAEGVDRNRNEDGTVMRINKSPSSRRAWIEIRTAERRTKMSSGRPPRGGRG